MGNTTETTSQDLYSHLYEACNILRGPINQDEYKSYVTPLLFFKRLSDVYDEETKEALEETDGDEEYYMIETAAQIYCRPEVRFSARLINVGEKNVLKIVNHL